MSTFPTTKRQASFAQKKRAPKTGNGGDEGTLTEQEKRRMRQMRFSEENRKQKEDPRSYGFVSRGEDSRLQHSESAQREYFDWILETFKQVEKIEPIPKPGTLPENRPDFANVNSATARSEQVLSSLRKLREAMLRQRPSVFSKKVHLFSVRVSSAVGHYQTYIPSIRYLLTDAKSLLTPAEKREVASILVLHVAHRNSNNSKSSKLFFQHLSPVKDSRVLRTLLAWTSGDYSTWMHLYNTESDHSVFAVMSMGLPAMLTHMVACFSASYFTYPWEDMQQILPKGIAWAEFKSRHAPLWDLEDGVVHVRKRQRPKPKIQGEMVGRKPGSSSSLGEEISVVHKLVASAGTGGSTETDS